MALIRPELRARIWRWRETLIGAGLVILGLWVIERGSARLNVVFEGLGVAIAAIGAVIILASYRRILFRKPGHGVGVVEVTERQITYLGPFQGGSVRLEDLMRVELRHSIEMGQSWALKPRDGPQIMIPSNAEGAELLFDALALLPGMDQKKLLSVLNRAEGGRIIVWRRDGPVAT